MSAAFFRTLRSLATKGYKQCCGGFLSVMLFLGGWGPLDPVPQKWGWVTPGPVLRCPGQRPKHTSPLSASPIKTIAWRPR
jgi:hypothetical protein